MDPYICIMKAGSLPSFLFRSVLTPKDMNIITSSCHSTIRQPILVGQKQFFTRSYRHCHQQHRQENRSHRYKHSRLLAASGLGITLVAHGGSPDSDHLQNFCETNFDTIRHNRAPVPRSSLPSFASCTSFNENSNIGITSKSLDDGTDDTKSTHIKISYPSLRASQQSFESLESPPCNHPPIACGSSVHPHKKLGRTHSNHPFRSLNQSVRVDHDKTPLTSLPPPSSHQSPLVSPPASFRSQIFEASDTVFSAGTSSYQPPRSTRFSPRLRNCHSLQFVKQQYHQPPHLSRSNCVYPQSRLATPLATSYIINQPPSGRNPSPQPTLPAAYDSPAACYPSEELSSSNPTCVTSPPIKFTNFVRSTIQKTSRRSNSQPQSSLLDLNSQTVPTHIPSHHPAAIYYHNHSSHSLALSATPETSKSPLSQICTPTLGMTHHYKGEIESLKDQDSSPHKSAPYLRSSLSQPVLTEHYLKTSNTGSRSRSALDVRNHPILKRTGSSLSGLANASSVNFLGSTIHPQPPTSKGSHSTSNGSPPRKSMRTQFSRLAQFLAPSPASKNPPVTSRVKASSLTSKPKSLFSTGSSFKPTEHGSKPASYPVLDPLPLKPQCASTSAPMTVVNWRHSISDREYQAIIEGWGPVEIHRQQLIWELSQTENAFLDSLTLIMDFFINPLRKSDCDMWVAGVPEAVQKMFDDLDQIADLHGEMVMGMSYNRMCEIKRNKAPVVIRFADMMATFVPRLRIYERYLVCFEHVCTIIDQLSADQVDNFGVFVKIQSHAAGLGCMTLTSYLLKPIQRLMKYPLFFRQLCETTPVGHPDHLPTANLWKATDGIIRSMQDVKGLEDDHKTLQKLEERLTGVPDGLVLANRRRKLIARGTFRRVYPSSKDLLKLSESSRSKVEGNFATFKPIPKGPPPSSLALHGDFVNDCPAHQMVRCLSPVSDSSENSEGTQSQSSYHSMNTDSTFDLLSSPLVPIPRVSRTSWSTSGCSAESSPCPDRLTQDWAPVKIQAPRSLPNIQRSHNLIKRGSSTELIEVIVLSDLLILCVKESPPKKSWRSSYKKFGDLTRLKLLDGIGISRLVDAEDISGQLDHYEDLVRLKLLPELNSGNISKKKPQISPANAGYLYDDNVIYLSSLNVSNLPASGNTMKSSHVSTASWSGIIPSSTHNLAGSNSEQDWKNWLKEFKRLQFQTHHLYRRHVKYTEQKRRRSTTGKIDVSIKRCSSMSNL